MFSKGKASKVSTERWKSSGVVLYTVEVIRFSFSFSFTVSLWLVSTICTHFMATKSCRVGLILSSNVEDDLRL